MTIPFWDILKKDEAPSTYLNLNDETLSRINKINNIEDYFTTEIKEREAIGKKISKYIAIFDYIDKILIVLSRTSGGISIIFLALLELLLE